MLSFLQTIFHTLPRLACFVDEEWLPPELFSLADPAWTRDTKLTNHKLPLYNATTQLEACEPGTWKVKNLGELEQS